MVKLLSSTKTEGTKYRIEAVADTKEEVTDGVEIVGMIQGGTIDIGSTIITAEGDIAICKSDGTWNWLEDED